MQCVIQVRDDELIDHEIARAAQVLRRELSGLDVTWVDVAREAPQHGAKAGSAIEVGALALAFAPAVLPAVTSIIKGWVDRRAREQVSIEVRRGDSHVKVQYSPRSMSLSDLNDALLIVEHYAGDGEGK